MEHSNIEFRWVTLPSLGRKQEASTHIPGCLVVTNRVLATGLGIRQRGRAPTSMENQATYSGAELYPICNGPSPHQVSM